MAKQSAYPVSTTTVTRSFAVRREFVPAIDAFVPRRHVTKATIVYLGVSYSSCSLSQLWAGSCGQPAGESSQVS